MPRQSFSEVWHLWVAPDFSRVERGEIEPPWVDQRQVDFTALRQLYMDTFSNGLVDIRVPNDTIDQVTVHFREMSGTGGVSESMRCRDFANGLLEASRQQNGPVVDVAAVWDGLHHLAERRLVPPPIVLPMLVEAEDFEDMVSVQIAAKMRLGMMSGHPLEEMLSGRKSQERGDQQGYLPEAFRARLEEILGAEYIAEAVVDCGVAHDPHPEWVPKL
ncbi:hypothetical protein [Halomonas sp. C05BenzN]|uniref:hypothetical protein n=1 Tax=Halomonas sp. C05BenzN TaxID=3411041 RepID=UPI003B945730